MASIVSDKEAMQLIQSAQRADTRALARLYDLYAERVFRFVHARVSEAPTAEDLASDVFVSIVEKLEAFQPGPGGAAASLTAWIFTIARNRVIDHHRQTARRPTGELPDEETDDLLPANFHFPEPNVENVNLMQAIQRLTEEQQSVILLRFQQDLTFAQSARTLAKSEEAVKAMHRRALASLARFLVEPTQAGGSA